MKNDRHFFTNKLIGFLILIILIVSVAVAFGYKFSEKETNSLPATEITEVEETTWKDSNLLKLVLNVSGMSCSGCISTIKGSLSNIKGIQDILVDISNGKTEVYFNSDKLKDTTRIEKAITESGYPARIQKVISAKDIKKEMDIATANSQYYIVSVGGYEVARVDFETELNAARKKYENLYGEKVFASAQGGILNGQLKAQIVSRLIEEGILMQEISRSGFKISADKVEEELQKFFETSGKKEETFQATLQDAGYSYDYFKKKFETRVLINNYFNEKVLAEASNPYDKQNLFNTWFNNTKVLAEVVYYDKELEGLGKKSERVKQLRLC